MGQYRHACFISYKHPPRQAPPTHFYNVFARAFQDQLEAALTSDERSYCDTTLKPGESYPPVLADCLCKSACLIAILTPEYPNSTWCAAEWEAMERLETRRLGGRKELIIPVVFRGEPAEWESQYQRRPVDLRVDAPREQLRSVRNVRKINEIAYQVGRCLSHLKAAGTNDIGCGDFAIRVNSDEDRALAARPEPSAIGWS